MEWITAIRKSVEFIEEHLKDKISAQDVANQVYMWLLHFQKEFQLLTGYSVAEYIRNRKPYLAALDLKMNSAMTLQTMRFQNTGMKSVKNMQPMFMQEMRRQMNMKKLWWKIASENMVSALMMKN